MKYFSLLVGLLIIAGCGHMNIQIEPDQYKDKQGVLITASHLKEQTFLYFVKGARITFEDQSEIVIPWGESKFIDLEPGLYNYEIWYNYLGAKTGKSTGCLKISERSTLLLEYKAPYLTTQRGQVRISSILENQHVLSC